MTTKHPPTRSRKVRKVKAPSLRTLAKLATASGISWLQPGRSYPTRKARDEAERAAKSRRRKVKAWAFCAVDGHGHRYISSASTRHGGCASRNHLVLIGLKCGPITRIELPEPSAGRGRK